MCIFSSQCLVAEFYDVLQLSLETLTGDRAIDRTQVVQITLFELNCK